MITEGRAWRGPLEVSREGLGEPLNRQEWGDAAEAGKERVDSMNISLSKLREIVKDGEAWPAAVHGVTESDTTWRLNNNNKGGPCRFPAFASGHPLF